MLLAFDLVGWATLALAVATTVLAFATWRLIRHTKRTADAAEADVRQGLDLLRVSQEQVAATQDEASAAREALSVSVRPLLVPASGSEPVDTELRSFEVFGRESGQLVQPRVAAWSTHTSKEDQATEAWVIVRVRNIGTGPAIVDTVGQRPFLVTGYGGQVVGDVTSLVVAPQEFVYLTFADIKTRDEDPLSLAGLIGMAEQAPWHAGNTLTVVVRYSDVGRTRWTQSHMKFRMYPERRLDFSGIDIDPDPGLPGAV